MKERDDDKAYPQYSVSLPEPYPVPRVHNENYSYALLLIEDYAGAVGELTAVNQYIFHYLTMQDCHFSIAKLARQVALVEMRHFELLGKTIRLLGKLPIIQCNQRRTVNFWNSKFVYYGNTAYDKLSADIKHEEQAIRNYNKHRRQIEDPFIRELLDRIILDEEHHLRLFSEFRDILCKKYY